MPEGRVGLAILVGIDDDIFYLRGEALDHVRDHRPAIQQLQALVHAAHATALAAGQHDTRDFQTVCVLHAVLPALARYCEGGRPNSRLNMAENALGLS